MRSWTRSKKTFPCRRPLFLKCTRPPSTSEVDDFFINSLNPLLTKNKTLKNGKKSLFLHVDGLPLADAVEDPLGVLDVDEPVLLVRIVIPHLNILRTGVVLADENVEFGPRDKEITGRILRWLLGS